MKTTVEIPDAIYRQIKARAALQGGSIKDFLNGAIRDKLGAESGSAEATGGWQAVFGKAPPDAIDQVKKLIDEEFSKIDEEEWK